MVAFTMWVKNVYMITLIHGVSNVITAIVVVIQAFAAT
jgi:hypothetical protein